MRLLTVLLLFCALSPGQKTDLATYAIPAPPTLPAAGGTFVDPVFGSTIMRITDASTSAGRDCHHDYSYTDVSTRNDRRLIVGCSDPASILAQTRFWFDFDPVTLTLGAKTAWPNTPDGFVVVGDFVSSWNPTDENGEMAYVFDGSRLKIWDLNVVTGAGSYSLVKTFSGAELPASTASFNTATISRDGDVFAALTLDSGGTETGCFAWRRSTDTVLYKRTSVNTNECQVDKSGDDFAVKLQTDPGDGTHTQVVYLPTATVTALTKCAPNWAPFHSDFGRRFMVAHSPFWSDCSGSAPQGGQRLYHNMATLGSVVAVTPSGASAGSDGHVSLRADADERATMEWYIAGTYPDPGGPMHGEIWRTWVDGSMRAERLAHHHTNVDSNSQPYRGQPMATASRSELLTFYNTNNGVFAGRIDLLVVVAARRSATPASSGVTGF